MQRYRILHRTYYNFAGQVTLGQHVLRLRPRENFELQIVDFSVHIMPQPVIRWQQDVEGNSVGVAIFDAPSDQLFVESIAHIIHHNQDPFNFLVESGAMDFPFQYAYEDSVTLAPYRMLPEPAIKAKLDEWISTIWQPGEAVQSFALLQRLNSAVNQRLGYQIREEPGVQTAAQTLEYGSGSCRDYATLFMEAARCLGFAARFVSGYLHSLPSMTNYGSTHAWAEVYLPGAGWKGFDPTTGVVTAIDHIPVAVSRLPEAVPPIAGSFSGPVSTGMEVGVWVTPS